MKRKMIICLIFLLVFTMIPSNAFAETDSPYAIFNSNDESLTFYYGAVPLSVEAYETLYSSTDFDDALWYENYDSITTVIFDSSMEDCTIIESTEWWFADFTNLESVIGLEYFNTSNVANMVSMFSGCTSLTSLDLSTFNTENVIDMQDMFSGCTNLVTLDLTSFDTSNSNNMSNLFKDCSSLKSIYATDKLSLNARAKAEAENIFYGCSNLTGDFGTMLEVSEYDNETEAISYFRLDTLSNPGLFSTGKPFTVKDLKVSNLDQGKRIGDASVTGTVTKDGNVIKGTWVFVNPDTILKDIDYGVTSFEVKFVPTDFSFREGDELIKTVTFTKNTCKPCPKKPVCIKPCVKKVNLAINTCVKVTIIKVCKIINLLCRHR